MISFSELLEISFFHDYYSSGRMEGVSVVPDDATQLLLRHYDFRYVVKNSKFIVSYFNKPGRPDLGEVLFEEMGEKPLVFDVFTSDPYFSMISDIPFQLKGMLFYTSGLGVKKDGVKMLSEVFEIGTSPRIASIKIFAKDLFNKKGKVKQGNYAVSVAARKIRWDYLVVNRSNISINDSEIREDDQSIFSAPVQKEMSGGRSGLLYSSGKNLMAFSQKPNHKFDLVTSSLSGNLSEGQKKYKTIIKGLPCPNPSSLKLEQKGKKKELYSEMYIYI